jgi:hypothetical protein
MRKQFLYFVILGLAFTACKEVPPAINYEVSKKLKDTAYITTTIPAAQPKNVLIEDVSGVQCVNCPDAAVIAKQVMDANPDRAFSVVMHPNTASLNSLCAPVDKEGYKSLYDFRTGDASKIVEMLGTPNSLPSGYINRRLFSGQTNRFTSRTDWASLAGTELSGTTPVNIDLTNEFNSASNEGVISIKLTYTAAVTKKQYITIMLMEDSILDVQEYQDKQTFEVKFNPNYVHMHVLRDVITYATGDAVSETITNIGAGQVFEKQYAYKLRIEDQTNNQVFNVVPKNAKILVFVQEDAPDYNIVQVKEIGVTE